MRYFIVNKEQTQQYIELLSKLLIKICLSVRWIRVYNTRSMILFYLLGRALVHNLVFDKELIFMPIIFILAYAYASILNFEHDYEIDAYNKKNSNPFIGHTITYKTLRLVYICLISCAILFSLLTKNPLLTSITISTFFLLSYIYSAPRFRVSFHPLGKIAVMITFYIAIPTVIGLNGILTSDILKIVLPLSLYYSSFLLYSDIKDREGDKKYGKRTLAVVLGIQPILWFSAVLGICSAIMLLLVLNLSGYLYIFARVLIFTPALLQIIAARNPTLVLTQKYAPLTGYLLIAIVIFLILLTKMRYS